MAVMEKRMWEESSRSKGELKRTLGRFLHNRNLMMGFVIAVAYVALALLAPVISPYDPTAMGSGGVLMGPSAAHPFGTDEFGRDILSRIVWGARPSLLTAAGSVLLSLVVGGSIGTVAGFYGGRLDAFAMRCMDVFLAFPALLLAIAIMAVLGQSGFNVVLAIGVVYIPQFARVARSAVLTVKNLEFVQSARAIGVTPLSILVRHVTPNIASSLIVQASLTFSLAVLYESALTFLGLGTAPPTPSWGLMLSDGRQFMELAPWTAVFPGAAIMFLVLGFNLLGDGLRDFLDPKTKAWRASPETPP